MTTDRYKGSGLHEVELCGAGLAVSLTDNPPKRAKLRPIAEFVAVLYTIGQLRECPSSGILGQMAA